MTDLKNNFCQHPWLSADITPQRAIKPCCKFETYFDGDLDEYLNSEFLSNLKTQFLNGERPSECFRCWNDEAAGIKSKRLIDKEYLLNNINQDKLAVISFAFGNTCNLACRTCSSVSSSKWHQEEKKLIDIFPDTKIYNHLKFYKDPDYINSIKRNSTHLKDITFVGGESFITGVPEQIDFLDHLIRLGKSREISLTYTTNCTTFAQKEFITRWEHFKQVNILMSVDGLGEKFEYLRWPANWDQCYENIKKYQEQKSLKVSISHTVSVFNVFDLPEFFKWCLKEKLPLPYIGMVDYPEHYSVVNLPPEAKAHAKLILRGKHFEPVADYMVGDSKLGPDLLRKYVMTLDEHRGQNCSTTFPTLWEFIKK